ncbi:MAG: CHASE domain-containing protein [Ardenticatenaceae bacterium]|nr:CHASE domain-containing protein [Ardenticatenaceae bacterium]
MAAFASANPDRLGDTFPAYAAQLYDLTPDVRSIQIAPDGILTYIYPLAGNEEALGLDLANHPDRRESFERTVHRNTLSLSGPLN